MKRLDFPLILSTILILVISNFLIFSSASGGINFMEKQITYSIIGIVLSIGVFFIPINIYEKIAGRLYLFNFIILFLVLLIGININGAKRWFNLGFMNFQPSELAKILIIICLSVYLYRRSNHIESSKVYWGSFLYVLIPVLLILKEPDLGTSLVIIFIWFMTNLCLGTKSRNIIISILLFLVLISSVWFIPGILKPYQRERIITFVNPEADTLNTGYHVTQSKIAIGSGGPLGKGFLQGGQRALNFIPEQHTDFIFTVVGEEWGLLGCSILLFLYLVLIYRIILIALETRDLLSKGIVMGICSMFVFQLFTNIGMTLGIMPVTGIPLIFVSYGGTSLICNLLAIGLILGIKHQTQVTDFFKSY